MIPGNLDKLLQKIWAACKRKTKGFCPGNARGKMDADPLAQKAPHGSVGLAGARLKDPLCLSSGSRRHAEGEFCYHCKQQDGWPSSLRTKGVEETTHSPSHCGLVLKRAVNGVRLLVCGTGLTEGKDPSVGPGLTALMCMVPRMRWCSQIPRYFWYCWLRTTLSRQEAGLLTPTPTTSLDIARLWNSCSLPYCLQAQVSLKRRDGQRRILLLCLRPGDP